MSKPRFSRASVSAILERYIAGSMQGYAHAARKEFDPSNGTNQVPKGNADAMYYYGRITAFKIILSEVQ